MSYLTNGYLNTVIDWIPGMEGIRLKDLPTFIRTTDANDIMVNFALGGVENARNASALLFNTIDDLEHEVLRGTFSYLSSHFLYRSSSASIGSEAPVQAHLNEIEVAFAKANFRVDLDKKNGGRGAKKKPISVLSKGLKGGYSVCVEGELKGTIKPSLFGKKGVIDIIERNYCSGKLERNSTMVPIYVNCLGKEIASIFSKRRSGKKSSPSLKSHSMKTRGSSIHNKIQHQIREVQNKVGWSLEEEIVKVLKKGMALGFEFNGKKKKLLEIINSRKKDNDTRFHVLVRNLVQKLKPSMS
ncbi:hypothetical protein LWI28_016713 [Acer negundo]|uniref:Uncharacterized protein n=1 Tax=Acer negundo TaxID=4023 RepID=A0AAD5IIV6_ACENE|nr:hypothetical protein LWI28_016713 [Acer negundo]